MTRNAGQSLDLERYYWLDAQIRRDRYPNATTLAAHFEISRKAASATIQRLQDDLRAPLEYDSSRKGYRYADTAFRLPPLWLQEPTAAALLVAQGLLSRLLLNTSDPEDARAAQRVAFLAGVPQKLKARLAFETLEHHPPSSEVFSKVLHALAHSVSRPWSKWLERLHGHRAVATLKPDKLIDSSPPLIGSPRVDAGLNLRNFAAFREQPASPVSA